MPFRIDARESPLRLGHVDAPDGWSVGTPDDLAGHGDALIAEARVHGAVMGMASDLDDEPLCWAFVVLRVDAPWLIVDTETGPRPLLPASAGDDDIWYVALWPSDEGDIHVPATAMITPDDDGWSGESWRIRPHPLTRMRGRDWRWRTGNSGGPHSLTIRSQASAADVIALFESCAPLPYRRDDARYVGPDYVGSAPYIKIFDGSLSFMRSYTDPQDHVRACDTGLVLMLASGAIGDITWLVWEHDWESPVACGDDGASLHRYLVDDAGEVCAEQDVRVTPFAIDATGTTDDDEIVRTIERVLATRAERPAYAVLVLAVPLGSWWERVHRLHPRTIWRVEGRPTAVAPASD